MKKLLTTLTGIVSATAILALVAGCQTVATNQAELATSKKEVLLAQAGFKAKTVTTPKAATTAKPAGRRQGLGGEVPGEIILRVSDSEEGPDPRREPSPIQRV